MVEDVQDQLKAPRCRRWRAEFGLNQAQAGLLATVGLVGAFLGALFWGTISDYIGRRTSFSATIGIFSLFTGLVAASWNVLSLSVLPLPLEFRRQIRKIKNAGWLFI